MLNMDNTNVNPSDLARCLEMMIDMLNDLALASSFFQYDFVFESFVDFCQYLSYVFLAQCMPLGIWLLALSKTRACILTFQIRDRPL